MRLKTQAVLENNNEAFKLINLLNTIKRWREMEALRTGAPENRNRLSTLYFYSSTLNTDTHTV